MRYEDSFYYGGSAQSGGAIAGSGKGPGTLAITRRKKVVARLSPPKDETKVEFPDFKARAKKAWAGEWRGAGSDVLLDESRGEQ